MTYDEALLKFTAPETFTARIPSPYAIACAVKRAWSCIRCHRENWKDECHCGARVDRRTTLNLGEIGRQ